MPVTRHIPYRAARVAHENLVVGDAPRVEVAMGPEQLLVGRPQVTSGTPVLQAPHLRHSAQENKVRPRRKTSARVASECGGKRTLTQYRCHGQLRRTANSPPSMSIETKSMVALGP